MFFAHLQFFFNVLPSMHQEKFFLLNFIYLMKNLFNKPSTGSTTLEPGCVDECFDCGMFGEVPEVSCQFQPPCSWLCLETPTTPATPAPPTEVKESRVLTVEM